VRKQFHQARILGENTLACPSNIKDAETIHINGINVAIDVNIRNI
jgi:hypothetical protein